MFGLNANCGQRLRNKNNSHIVFLKKCPPYLYFHLLLQPLFVLLPELGSPLFCLKLLLVMKLSLVVSTAKTNQG
jgi:hypothetical protein